jgi:predicted SAM-dependent methyltransferase
MDILKEIDRLRIDLACGNNKKEGFFGIDVAETPSTDYIHDLTIYPWPIKSESVEEVHCSHYIEHIPHENIRACLKKSNSFEEFKESLLNSKDGLIEFFNELYRILKPGGKAKLIAPYYSSMRSVGDPTHVRSIADSTFWYIVKKWIVDNNLEHYGLECDFDVKIHYYITNDMTLKSEEVRNKAFIHDLNTVEDIIIELIKK